MVKPDLVVPANKIFSVLDPHSFPANQPQTVVVPAPFGSPNYVVLSRTSMSAATASGAVAVLLADGEGLTTIRLRPG